MEREQNSALSRRGFLGSGLTAAGLSISLMSYLHGEDTIQGFNETQTDTDDSVWKPFSDKKVRVGIVGHGICQFGAAFGFQDHPNVDVAAVSDLIPERRSDMAAKCRCEKTYDSLEEMLKDDSIEAVFLATDAPSHARQSVMVLEHGKHVCHAVPAFMGDIDDGERLLEAVKKNPGLKYMMFETSVFRDDLYAMEKLYAAGVFGQIAYSEGEYHHPRSIGAPYLGSYGGWRDNLAPMWYPTHASAYYVGITHGRFLDVTARGVGPQKGEEPRTVQNPYDTCVNPFGGEFSLSRTSDGGLFRMCRSNTQGEGIEGGRVRGQYAGFDSHNAHVEGFVGDAEGKRRLEEALAGGLKLKKYPLPPGVDAGGHGGSHGYLTDNFVRAILLDQPTKVDIRDSLHMTAVGYYAHLSALKDGETITIPEYSF
ncbi:MAG: Gfo/Idh/MocA family oxidoreductase [Thermoguttaceae bacterium]|nr:Gfo/Idh/MocA family oxidoreductase [Thermoguttaceae bacterium]